MSNTALSNTALSAPPVTAAALADEEGNAVPESHRTHYDRWAPLAAVEVAEPIVPYVEGSLAHANAAATQAWLNHPDRAGRIAALHLRQDLLQGVESIALAYLFASALARASEPATTEPVGPILRAARKDKHLLLSLARAAAAAGRIPEEVVRHIEAGSGNRDLLQDLLDLILLLRGDARSVVVPGGLLDEAGLAAIEARATLAQRVLRPQGAPDAPVPTDAERAALVLTRNRLWTLLVRAHDEALLAAAHLVGVRQVFEAVPALGSRQGLAKVVTPPAPA